ncbi:hypothetical protein ADUPG1_009028 [Aduncisulcus paluster]|uniref:Uncharacterized protein n=1 Tax=Aduncisulcus paluster TaxID=2918883 RepID=A0ABQ5KY39_9EUKA|nr:hypothetical protein ADUPG1_009028 [Aduncisulcus paluster]
MERRRRRKEEEEEEKKGIRFSSVSPSKSSEIYLNPVNILFLASLLKSILGICSNIIKYFSHIDVISPFLFNPVQFFDLGKRRCSKHDLIYVNSSETEILEESFEKERISNLILAGIGLVVQNVGLQLHSVMKMMTHSAIPPLYTIFRSVLLKPWSEVIREIDRWGTCEERSKELFEQKNIGHYRSTIKKYNTMKAKIFPIFLRWFEVIFDSCDYLYCCSDSWKMKISYSVLSIELNDSIESSTQLLFSGDFEIDQKKIEKEEEEKESGRDMKNQVQQKLRSIESLLSRDILSNVISQCDTQEDLFLESPPQTHLYLVLYFNSLLGPFSSQNILQTFTSSLLIPEQGDLRCNHRSGLLKTMIQSLVHGSWNQIDALCSEISLVIFTILSQYSKDRKSDDDPLAISTYKPSSLEILGINSSKLEKYSILCDYSEDLYVHIIVRCLHALRALVVSIPTKKSVHIVDVVISILVYIMDFFYLDGFIPFFVQSACLELLSICHFLPSVRSVCVKHALEILARAQAGTPLCSLLFVWGCSVLMGDREWRASLETLSCHGLLLDSSTRDSPDTRDGRDKDLGEGTMVRQNRKGSKTEPSLKKSLIKYVPMLLSHKLYKIRCICVKWCLRNEVEVLDGETNNSHHSFLLYSRLKLESSRFIE